MANNNGFWSDRMIELLIHKVRSYNALYDYTLREYMDPEIKHNAFREIGEQMDGIGNPIPISILCFLYVCNF